MARDRGFAINASALSSVEAATFSTLLAPDALGQSIQATGLSDPTPNDSYLLMAAASAGIERSLTTAVHARQLLSWQQSGHWVTSDFRPPHSSSLFTATATAVRAILFYTPEELNVEKQRAVAQAREWLRKTPPASTEDAAFRLMGLVWAGGDPRDISLATRDLISLQTPDGGWPQLPGYASDAYSTGESLVALREAGMEATLPLWQRGARFLLSTQASDGTWRVKTRMISPATVSPPYFSTGFPYGKEEFLSYAGTAWAVMALLREFPEPAPVVLRDARAPEPWIRTALLGSSQDLARLLNGGLDVNSKTSNGTSLLMMAATDVQKVKLLLSRGADVKARSSSGNDALTIATAYRGTAPSIRLLLNAGADIEPPANAHVRRLPLVSASMAGDLENVKLLLNRGADASAGSPIAEAITFGRADVVQALIRAGADTGLREGSGVNLLHWATITDRAAVIPILARAGVPLDDTDKAGFTPLMYAATVDHGNTASLRALLAAGADSEVRNPDGRNALEQTRHFQHKALEAELLRQH